MILLKKFSALKCCLKWSKSKEIIMTKYMQVILFILKWNFQLQLWWYFSYTKNLCFIANLSNLWDVSYLYLISDDDMSLSVSSALNTIILMTIYLEVASLLEAGWKCQTNKTGKNNGSQFCWCLFFLPFIYNLHPHTPNRLYLVSSE